MTGRWRASARLTYKLTDQWSLTAGGRYAKMGFSLNHYANGYENYGPELRRRLAAENAFTPKLERAASRRTTTISYYATYAKGFRPGGYNPPLPPCSAAPA